MKRGNADKTSAPAFFYTKMPPEFSVELKVFIRIIGPTFRKGKAEMKANLGILDKDVRYAEYLASTLNETDFEYHAFCLRPEDIEKEGCADSFDFMLLDENFGQDFPGKIRTERICYLSSIPGYDQTSGIPVIYKYQPLSKVKESILRYGSERDTEARAVSPVRGPHYIGIGSSAGRTMKTEFGFVLGQLLSREEKVLFISLEPFSEYEVLFETEFHATFSDVLYTYVSGKKNPEMNLSDLVQKFHGMDFVPPVLTPEDLLGTSPEQMLSAIRNLTADGNYTVTIIDFAEDYRTLKQSIPMLDQIFIMTSKDSGEEKKTDAFVDWIERSGPPGKEPMLCRALLPSTRLFSHGRKYLEQLIWSPIGDYVRELLAGIR